MDIVYGIHNYPNKQCVLCNSSERSTLGHGDIIKFKISNPFDQKSIDTKRNKSDAMDTNPSNANQR